MGSAYGRTRVGGDHANRYLNGCTDSRAANRTSSYTGSCAYVGTDGSTDSHADDGTLRLRRRLGRRPRRVR